MTGWRVAPFRCATLSQTVEGSAWHRGLFCAGFGAEPIFPLRRADGGFPRAAFLAHVLSLRQVPLSYRRRPSPPGWSGPMPPFSPEPILLYLLPSPNFDYLLRKWIHSYAEPFSQCRVPFCAPLVVQRLGRNAFS